MSVFNDPGVLFSDPLASQTDDTCVNRHAIKNSFKTFLRDFQQVNMGVIKYEDILKQNYNLGNFYLEVNVEDITDFDDQLGDKIYKRAVEVLPCLLYTSDAADE